MKNKFLFMLGIVVITIIFFNVNVYAVSRYSLPLSYDEYDYPDEYKKYIGLYYRVKTTENNGNPTFIRFNEYHPLYKGIFDLDVTVKRSELDNLINRVKNSKSSGGLVCYNGYDLNMLEELFEKSSTYKMKEYSEINLKGGNTIVLEKGTMTIIEDDGDEVKIPHYVICHRSVETAGETRIKTIETIEYDTSRNITNHIKVISRTYNNFKTNTNVGNYGNQNNNTSNDFWGDASTWFGQAQQSGYTPPEQVNEIIGIFEDMINVVGTTIIIVATIILGIKYIIGTVDSKTSAKEGLITLFVACVFFFGWTSIKNLLFPGNEFIFTSSSDTQYKDMVGRLFATFTYIAQFVVVGSIIYIGVRYIFAGADGRADLKGKSVYFIIGIILVFATTNVLAFVSDVINEAIEVEENPVNTSTSIIENNNNINVFTSIADESNIICYEFVNRV